MEKQNTYKKINELFGLLNEETKQIQKLLNDSGSKRKVLQKISKQEASSKIDKLKNYKENRIAKLWGKLNTNVEEALLEQADEILEKLNSFYEKIKNGNFKTITVDPINDLFKRLITGGDKLLRIQIRKLHEDVLPNFLRFVDKNGTLNINKSSIYQANQQNITKMERKIELAENHKIKPPETALNNTKNIVNILKDINEKINGYNSSNTESGQIIQPSHNSVAWQTVYNGDELHYT